jgi:predicted RNA binding protein YcfA (HicA-like mRNA interferase family)
MGAQASSPALSIKCGQKPAFPWQNFYVVHPFSEVACRRIPQYGTFCLRLSIEARMQCTYDTRMTSEEILKLLRNDGWFVYEQSSSHIQLKHPTKKGRITVPEHKGDLKRNTVFVIFKQAGGIGIGI